MDIFAYISGPKYSDYFKLINDKYYGLIWDWESVGSKKLTIPVFLIKVDSLPLHTMHIKFSEAHLSCPVEIRSM